MDAMDSVFRLGTQRTAWPHQLEAVEAIVQALKAGRRNLLVQHATGSGKSATMALLVHELAEKAHGFALILVLSDRLQLDRQLGDSLETFLARQRHGLSGGPKLRRCEARVNQLMKVLSSMRRPSSSEKTLVVVTTKQKLDRVLSDHLPLDLSSCGRVAVICEECHRAHFEGGKTAEALRRLFGAGASSQPEDLAYIGFTGTPSATCLQLFGAAPGHPVHCYHLKQAEEQGVVLDVLANYSTCPPVRLTEKCRYILGDLESSAKSYDKAFAMQMKAMIVCRRRVDVVSYVQTLRQVADESWLPGLCARSPGFYLNKGICGFFSGAVENVLEEQLNGLPLLEACRSARILVVCNKLETGFDEPRLCVMYLDRCLESEVKIVQVLSRINRPTEGKGHVYVRDFHGQHAAVRAAFDAFRSMTLPGSQRGSSTGAPRRRCRVTEEIISQHDVQLAELFQQQVPLRRIFRVSKMHQRLRRDLRLAGRGRLLGLLKATRRLAEEAPSTGGRIVFVDQKVASTLLRRIIPSSRYGGLRRQRGSSRVTAHLQENLEQGFREAMMTAPKVGLLSQEHRIVLQADDGGVEATLCGPAERMEEFWKVVSMHRSHFFQVAAEHRSANTEVPYPVFICSKGRAHSGFFEWRAEHCLGLNSSGCPVVIVVEPQEEAIYRSHWPDAMLLVLPRPGETAIGYVRWVVQKICTGSRGGGQELQLPFIWMADDLLLSFYRLESVKLCQKAARTRILKALPRKGFWEAFLAVQRRQDICDISIAGFLRDRGASVLVKNDWVMDGSLALQKVVLLNLSRLRELGVEYCPLLRKSEDLALCYEVAQTPGGHLLKCQSYAYRARHLDRGGAEEVRRECRAAGRGGAGSGELGRLVLGEKQLTEKQKSVVEALLTWLARARRSMDGHGDLDDGVEPMTPGEREVDASCKRRGFMDWLSKLPKVPPSESPAVPKSEPSRPTRFLDFLNNSAEVSPAPAPDMSMRFLDFLNSSKASPQSKPQPMRFLDFLARRSANR